MTSNPGKYGAAHRALRRRWAPLVAAGGVDCARCGQPIGRRDRWDLGHVPGSSTEYAGPEHAECNRNTAAERGAADPRPRPRTNW